MQDVLFKNIQRFALVLIIFMVLGCGNGGEGTTTSPSGVSATAKCKDGTLSYSQNCSGTCSSHGGVSVWYTSKCGNKAVANTSITPSAYRHDINGLWDGTFRWHKDGVVTNGQITLSFQAGRIVYGELCNAFGDKYNVTGHIDIDNLMSLHLANQDNTSIVGDIEQSYVSIIGNLNVTNIVSNNTSDGIMQLELTKTNDKGN